MELEKHGVPVATIISAAFTGTVQMELRTFGFNDYPLVEVPHPFGNRSREWIEERAAAVLTQVLGILTSV